MRPRELILLAGSGRPTRFTSAISRSVLEMPLSATRSILGVWQGLIGELSNRLGGEPLGVRLVVDSESPLPDLGMPDAAVGWSIERDPVEYRGTGGVLSDLCRDHEEDDYILVANATQIGLGPLGEPCRLLAERPSGVTLYDSGDGTPISLMLIRCGALRNVPGIGFIDLKEQALGDIAKMSGVEVVEGPRIVGRPIRTLDAYIRTIREVQRLDRGEELGPHDPFEETWRPTFSLVEEGATVSPDARVHESVVLRGARLEAKSAVVRSVVCSGGVVKKGSVVSDRVVGGRGPAMNDAKGGSLER